MNSDEERRSTSRLRRWLRAIEDWILGPRTAEGWRRRLEKKGWKRPEDRNGGDAW